MLRGRHHVFVATVMATAALLIGAVPVLANSHAIGYEQDGNAYGGGYVQSQLQQLWTLDWRQGYHTNYTIWVYTDQGQANCGGSSCWGEVGYTFGYHGTLAAPPTYMTYYVAWDNPSSGYQDAVAPRQMTSDSIGSSYAFEVQQVSSSEYDMYINGVYQGADSGASPLDHASRCWP